MSCKISTFYLLVGKIHQIKIIAALIDKVFISSQADVHLFENVVAHKVTELTFIVGRASYQAFFLVKMWFNFMKPIIATDYVGFTTVKLIAVKWGSNFFKIGYDENVCVVITSMQIASYLGFPHCIAHICKLFSSFFLQLWHTVL